MSLADDNDDDMAGFPTDDCLARAPYPGTRAERLALFLRAQDDYVPRRKKEFVTFLREQELLKYVVREGEEVVGANGIVRRYRLPLWVTGVTPRTRRFLICVWRYSEFMHASTDSDRAETTEVSSGSTSTSPTRVSNATTTGSTSTTTSGSITRRRNVNINTTTMSDNNSSSDRKGCGISGSGTWNSGSSGGSRPPTNTSTLQIIKIEGSCSPTTTASSSSTTSNTSGSNNNSATCGSKRSSIEIEGSNTSSLIRMSGNNRSIRKNHIPSVNVPET